MKKFKGFKVSEVNSFEKIFIKRKHISYYKQDDGLFCLYSYNDHGYKVRVRNQDLNKGLEDIISELTIKLKASGDYSLKKRETSDTEKKRKVIFWWEKGYDRKNNQEHYKCDTIASDGFSVEGIGETLRDAVESLLCSLNDIEVDLQIERDYHDKIERGTYNGEYDHLIEK